MAQRRMFSKNITNSSKFLKMPMSTRLLYYDLGMNADDDGFVEHFMVLRMTGATQQDLGVLQANNLIKIFDENVLWIRDWKENNYIRNDRYQPSKYIAIYNLDTIGIPEVDLGKDRIELGKDSIGNNIDNMPIQTNWINNEKCECETKSGKICLRRSIYKIDGKNYCNQHSRQVLGNYYKTKKEKYGEFENVLLTGEEYYKLEESNLLPYIEKLSSYIASKGKKYKSHYATILNWSRKERKEEIMPEWLDKEIKKENLTKQEQNEINNLLEEYK